MHTPEYLKESNWIWIPAWNEEDTMQARVVLFRKSVELEGRPLSGVVNISADTRYKLYVNGSLVEVGPSRGDHQIWFYDAIDITRYLQEGLNVIGASVLRYPEDPETGNHGMFRTPTPGLYLTGEIHDMAGHVYDIAADATWKSKLDDKVSFYREEEHFAPLVVHENTAGNPATFGWREADFDDSDWPGAMPYKKFMISEAVSPANLQPRNIPYMQRKQGKFIGIMDMVQSAHTEREWMDLLEWDKPVYIPPRTEETVVLDAGEEMTGYITAAFSGGEGATVRLLYAEAYVQDGFVGPAHVPVKANRLDKENGHLQGYQDTYHVAGLGSDEKPETYESYWFRTFRFVQLHVCTGEQGLTIHRLDYEETGYPLVVQTAVHTSDPTLDPIWTMSERTLRRCMHETYEDCPYYEQLQYIMDSRTQALCTYALSADDRLARKCMDDFRRSQRYDGLLNCSYPNCTINVIPGFSIYYILMVHDHMMYFGDGALVEEHMPAIEQILGYFERHLTRDGYVEKIGGVNMEARFWSFIDWAEEWNETSGMPTAGLKGPLTMETLLYIYGLQHAAHLADFLGRTHEADAYRERAQAAREAVRDCCMGSNGMIQDGPGVDEYSQQCQVFGILTDTLDDTIGRENLLKTIEEPGYTQCTVAMRFYLFRALEKTGLYAYTDKYWDTWRKMVEMHCTTCVESEAYARSECHGWGAFILYELPSITLGVRPAAPGYKKVRIVPVTGYMTNAAGVVKTPVGDIRVAWRMRDGALKMDYEVPQGLEVVQRAEAHDESSEQ